MFLTDYHTKGGICSLLNPAEWCNMLFDGETWDHTLYLYRTAFRMGSEQLILRPLFLFTTVPNLNLAAMMTTMLR